MEDRRVCTSEITVAQGMSLGGQCFNLLVNIEPNFVVFPYIFGLQSKISFMLKALSIARHVYYHLCAIKHLLKNASYQNSTILNKKLDIQNILGCKLQSQTLD